jgi:hypothetical protein
MNSIRWHVQRESWGHLGERLCWVVRDPYGEAHAVFEPGFAVAAIWYANKRAVRDTTRVVAR